MESQLLKIIWNQNTDLTVLEDSFMHTKNNNNINSSPA